MNRTKLNQTFLLLAVVLLFNTSIISARPEYSVKESRNCPYCHSREGPPQLNEVGAYYATNNHSLEGYVPSPQVTATPEPTEEVEIGVHMDTWDVGLRALATILLILLVVYIIRL